MRAVRLRAAGTLRSCPLGRPTRWTPNAARWRRVVVAAAPACAVSLQTDPRDQHPPAPSLNATTAPPDGSGSTPPGWHHPPRQEQQQQQQHGAAADNKVLTFKFRHFTLEHGGPCAMRMGTDAMLLGAWAEPPPHTDAVLDVGTGSGVLALMMAQKTQQHHAQQQRQPALARIHAIDIDAAAAAQARVNAARSPWPERLLVAHASLQGWAQHSGPHAYDLIISNPPFFLRSSKPAQRRRAAARHADDCLPFGQLAACSAALLRPRGRLCVVLPAQEALLFCREAAAVGLQLTRLTQVFTKASDPQPKRHLMQFEHTPCAAAVVDSDDSDGMGAAAAADTDPGGHSSGSSTTSSTPQAQQQPAVVPERLVIQVMRQGPDVQDGGGGGLSTAPGGRSAQAQAVWGFSEQYRRLTADFHHPGLL